MPDDIISDLLKRIADIAPPERRQHLEVEMRKHWGGSEVYVRKATSLQKALKVGSGISSGLTLMEAFDSAGVSRASGYRLLRIRSRR